MGANGGKLTASAVHRAPHNATDCNVGFGGGGGTMCWPVGGGGGGGRSVASRDCIACV
jgi:hypothetical protein